MAAVECLHELIARGASRWPERTALVDAGTGVGISYRELDELSDRMRDRLRAAGVGAGDRVGIYLRKSIDAVASMLGALKAGGVYVPVDPSAPVTRNAYVLSDCSVRAVVLEERFVPPLKEAGDLGAETEFLALEWGSEPGLPLVKYLDDAERRKPVPVRATHRPAIGDPAYILYTSGSTGRPKGVVLSHENALSFLGWCTRTFEPNERDRFSSHAPLHFDLSVLDVYLPLKHGSACYLVGEELGKNPAGMVELMVKGALTVWYSTPSALTLLVEHGKLERSAGALVLRYVLFAGEVFPIKHLRRLKALVPRPRYFNLYGPTETNVCTFHEIPEVVPEERVEPYPIGQVCSHLEGRVVDAAGRDVTPGQEGELCISGPSVMVGYWNLGERTRAAFLPDGDARWYRTGDLVVDEAGVHRFLGRLDRMVKRRGYRIELGEIETALYQHPEVAEVAAVAVSGDEGTTIEAYYSTRSGNKLSLIHLKQFCGERLPTYMIPDRLNHRPSLPRTSTDKIDYQRLRELD